MKVKDIVGPFVVETNTVRMKFNELVPRISQQIKDFEKNMKFGELPELEEYNRLKDLLHQTTEMNNIFKNFLLRLKGGMESDVTVFLESIRKRHSYLREERDKVFYQSSEENPQRVHQVWSLQMERLMYFDYIKLIESIIESKKKENRED